MIAQSAVIRLVVMFLLLNNATFQFMCIVRAVFTLVAFSHCSEMFCALLDLMLVFCVYTRTVTVQNGHKSKPKLNLKPKPNPNLNHTVNFKKKLPLLYL